VRHDGRVLATTLSHHQPLRLAAVDGEVHSVDRLHVGDVTPEDSRGTHWEVDLQPFHRDQGFRHGDPRGRSDTWTDALAPARAEPAPRGHRRRRRRDSVARTGILVAGAEGRAEGREWLRGAGWFGRARGGWREDRGCTGCAGPGTGRRRPLPP